ncbi:MAG: SEL1-like repeat protein [Chromatiaceae bacterium]|nr:SEL1-like repeat protein [Chromatiaceae bacterium]
MLGHGGFGITYLAWDDNLQLRLAIKEYLPRDCVSRGPDGVSLAVYSGQAGEQFAYGLDRFLEEARTLAHFDQHPGIVTVKNFFRAHGTGYCVMDYVAGITLRQYLDQQRDGRISVADALKLLMPVADALRAVHKEGLLHRDLAPDNIYLTQDGRIKLLDFGAARFAAGQHSKSLSVILKPGYAPEEQYRAKGKQGPWTDVYGFAATFYRAITGQIPTESLDRLDNDDLVPPSRLGIPIKPEQEAILLKGLAVKAGQRFQGMAEMQQAWRACDLSGSHPASERRAPTGSLDAVATPEPLKRGRPALILAMGGGLFLLAILGVILWQTTIRSTPWLAGDGTPPATPPTATPAPPSTAPITTAPPAPPSLGTVADGEMAFDQGKYDRARAILLPLAAAGDPVAQFYIGKMYAEGRGLEKDEVQGVNWYRKSAEQGHTKAENNLGVMYLDGKGVAKDEGEAARWFRKAADQGLPQAQNNLGEMYETGQGVVKDLTKAMGWYRKAAEQGYAPAEFNLGGMYDKGQGVGQDPDEAVHWYRKAAEQGHVAGQLSLAWMYEKGQGVTQDAVEAVRWYRKAAEQGDGFGQAKLGVMYANGRGVAKDEVEAVRWYRKAAEQGDVLGQHNLGVMYEYGQGVAKNEAEAVRWYRKAAEQGDADGQTNLGVMYANGQGVSKNEAEAVRWYRKAAEQGDARGQANLGVMYANGQGVTKDATEAVRWFSKAAEQGDARGQANLGVMYANGQGVAKNEAEAARWYRKAAEQGLADGQTFLGGMYAGGRGVVKDEVEAVHWFRKAAEQGHAAAQAALKELEDRMKSAITSNPKALATAKALEDQLACLNNPEPGKAIRAMLANGTFKLTEFKGDGIPVLAPTSEIRVYGKRVKFVSGWEIERDGVRDPFSRGPGTAPPLFIEVIFDAKPSEINYSIRQIRGADNRLQYPYSTMDQANEYYEKIGTTITCYGQYKENISTEPATPTPIYFAAELAPTANIPSEAPLCYKFIVSSLEEQLRKIKTKYPALYDDKITTNGDGSRTLLAKRNDETGKVISYFYSTSPKVCNEYQKNHLGTGIPAPPAQPTVNTPRPNPTSSQPDFTAADAKAAFDRRDYVRSFSLWRPLAQAGDAEAQNYFGYMYESGLGVAQDHGEAVRWYRKSAEQGLAEAQSNLGLSYVKGQGIAQNDAEGRRWFLKSAEQGFADAQYNLGKIYEQGVGVERDLAQARYWFRKAASQGQANARDALKEIGG